MSTNLTTRGRKRRSPGSIPPRMVSKSQPHWVIADWLGLMGPARGEGCPSGQHQRPAVPGKDMALSPHKKSFYVSTTLNNPGTKTQIARVDTAPQSVGTPTPLTGWLMIVRGSWSHRAARVASPDNVEVPPQPGRIMFYPRMRNFPISLQIQQPGDENRDRPVRYRTARCGNTKLTG